LHCKVVVVKGGFKIEVQEVHVSFIMPVLPSIHPFVDTEVLSSCWVDFCGMYCFIQICQKFQFGHNQTKLTDTLQNDLCKFLTSFVINPLEH